MKMVILILSLMYSTTNCYCQFFERISAQTIVTVQGYSQGCAWGDFNDDGNIDLFVTNSWVNDNDFLYMNNGDGTFALLSSGDIVNDTANSDACSWADYDNDGLPDLFIANVFNSNNSLYHNDGNGNFTKITEGEIVNNGGNSFGASWADYNTDGFVDLYVANYYDQPNFLYHNNGNGTFTRITEGNQVTDIENSNHAAWADLDNDGRIDLFVSNSGQNSLYKNNGDGTFTKLFSTPLTTDDDNSFGSSIGDYDNDGKLDIFVANWYGKNNLYKNLGDFNFEKVTEGEIVNEFCNAEGSSWGDFDNDGFIDLFVSNDGNGSLFRNNGDGFFTKLINDTTVTVVANENAASWCDYDNDGFLDLFVATGGNEPDLLFRNNGNSNHWINIQCIGTVSNKSAIGTKLFLISHCNETIVNQYHEISAQTGGGYGSQNSLNVEFGLGQSDVIDSLIIIWPSGFINIYTSLNIDTFYCMEEMPDNIIEAKTNNSEGLLAFPNPFRKECTIYLPRDFGQLLRLVVYDRQGKIIENDYSRITTDKSSIKFEATLFNAPGVYYIYIQSQRKKYHSCLVFH